MCVRRACRSARAPSNAIDQRRGPDGNAPESRGSGGRKSVIYILHSRAIRRRASEVDELSVHARTGSFLRYSERLHTRLFRRFRLSVRSDDVVSRFVHNGSVRCPPPSLPSNVSLVFRRCVASLHKDRFLMQAAYNSHSNNIFKLCLSSFLKFINKCNHRNQLRGKYAWLQRP